jgi:Flp pilus assembly protein TadD/chromosome segregation ATPase
MSDRIAKKLRLFVVRFAGAALLLVFASASAQAPPPISPAQFDPSDVYFQGYLAFREAEKLETEGNFVGAAEKLKRARELFETIKRYYPAWKSEMVGSRTAQNSEAEMRVHPKAQEQRRNSQNVVAELEGGVKKSGSFIDPAQGVVPLTPGILEVDPLTTRRLAEAEAEVKRLRELANRSSSTDSTEASRNASRVQDLTRQRDLAQNQLRAAENTVQALRAKLAVNPVENEMKALNQRIAGLEQEREAMASALGQSRSAHTEALSQIQILQADLKVMQQKHSDLDRDLKVERKVTNEVVSGQRAQLQALEKELTLKNSELGKANDRISGLINELQESRDAFAQLRTERDTLLQERDQMSAMLKLNEDGRIQDLVQQNIGLAKNLREANEKVDRLILDNNSAKDDITTALRDLAIAKSQINKLQQDRREQDARLQEFEKRLKGEEAALAKGQIASNPEEMATLREIIQRQLRVQERRRQARDLLVETVKDMGAKDERIAQAIKLFDGQEIQLTTAEQRLIADKQVDGEFVSIYAQDRAIVGRNTSELNRDIAVYERTAEKSFSAGRFLPTRELFQMIVEQHPGHVPALCKLGVVNLKLNDPSAAVDTFRRAVELDGNNPYAHRMLGFSFMAMGDLASAEQNVSRSVELAPDDAKSQLLLGMIHDRLGHTREAESCYKAAITADPVASDSYYNLARLYSLNAKRLEDARSYYDQALEHGAAPDPNLEQRLAKK